MSKSSLLLDNANPIFSTLVVMNFLAGAVSYALDAIQLITEGILKKSMLVWSRIVTWWSQLVQLVCVYHEFVNFTLVTTASLGGMSHSLLPLSCDTST